VMMFGYEEIVSGGLRLKTGGWSMLMRNWKNGAGGCLYSFQIPSGLSVVGRHRRCPRSLSWWWVASFTWWVHLIVYG
jgi:hypothetical protein